MEENALLRVQDLKVKFFTGNGEVVAVDGVSFSARPGEIVGIVGESGCGKSVMAQSVLRLLEETDAVSYEGEVVYQNQNLLALPLAAMGAIRGNEIAIVFQDPMSSLDPVYTVGNQIAEVMRRHKGFSKRQAMEKAVELLGTTGIPNPQRCAGQYPHELSGGMQQRVMSAMALACEPKLLIADEPTTALDVTIQAEILDLIVNLNKTLGMAVLFITHDLGVVSEICTSVRVMYLGQVVEEAPAGALFEKPLHPYTKGLLQSIPQLQRDKTQKLHAIEGTVPSLNEIPAGCRFCTRCPHVYEACQKEPPWFESGQAGHRVRCWKYRDFL
ncbi:MAG: ABC transporter ATP-binding protein [Oscillospiraceae bacterium]